MVLDDDDDSEDEIQEEPRAERPTQRVRQNVPRNQRGAAQSTALGQEQMSKAVEVSSANIKIDYKKVNLTLLLK